MEECKLQIQNNFLKCTLDSVDFQVELIQDFHHKKKEENKKNQKDKKRKKEQSFEEVEDKVMIAPFFITK